MKTEKIIWGLILVFIGGILLLDNLEVIDFHWGAVWRFWPFLLILSGVNLLFSRNNSNTGGIIAILITCTALAFIAYAGSVNSPDVVRWYDRGNDSRTDPATNENIFKEQFLPGTSRADLNIKGGASSFKLEGVTSDLLEVREKGGHYSLKKTSRDSTEVLDFYANELKRNWRLGDSEVRFKLNTFPIWNVDIEMGAGEIDFDLSSFKVENISVEGGAASFIIKLGIPQTITNLTVKTGVSDINISVPQSAGCQIKIESGFSSEDFEGFIKQTDGTFTTPNFNSASKKIIIDLKGGLSNFEVNRY